jgi:hypothetical protein
VGGLVRKAGGFVRVCGGSGGAAVGFGGVGGSGGGGEGGVPYRK